MKNAGWIVFGVFFALNAFDGFLNFGWQSVDLPPVGFFMFSLWVAVRNTVTYSLLPLALVFICGRFSRWVLIPLFIVCFFIECAAIYTRRTFGAELSDMWLQLLENTNLSEVINFISMSSSVLTVSSFIGVVIICIGVSWMLFTVKYPKITRMTLMKGLACLLPFFIFNCVLINWHFGVAQLEYTKFAVSSFVSYSRWEGVRRACANLNLPSVQMEKSKAPPDVVIVLGESATRSNWSLYGYPRKTTPRINALRDEGNLVIFDVVGTQPDTAGSLSLLLTDVMFDKLKEGNWTLAGVYNKAGYRCILISQQYSIKDTTSTLYRIFNGCEKRISVAHEFGRRVYDESVISLLEKELRLSDGRPNLIFIHLSGMHYPVQNVVPETENYFSDSVEPDVLKGYDAEGRDRINRYDNAILYEDKVLGGIIDLLDSSNRTNVCFFVSDHGESPRGSGWRIFEDKDVYSVPAIAWFSELYKNNYPDTVEKFKVSTGKRLQQDQITHGLLELGRLKTEFSGNSKYNFLLDNYKPRSPRVINKGRMIYEE